MENDGTYREVIYLPDITAETTPFYAMAVKRGASLRFLRNAMNGRLIHNGSWEEKITALFEN
jgi:hypothetical protein